MKCARKPEERNATVKAKVVSKGAIPVLTPAQVNKAVAQLRDVGSGSEDPAGSDEDQRARTLFELGAHLVEPVDHVLVDRVSHVGSRERRDDAVAGGLDVKRVSHRHPLDPLHRGRPP